MKKVPKNPSNCCRMIFYKMAESNFFLDSIFGIGLAPYFKKLWDNFNHPG